MMITYLTISEFDQDILGARQAANNDSVIITDRGRPTHVLLSIEEYQRLTANTKSVVDSLAMPNAKDVDEDLPKLSDKLFEPADFSEFFVENECSVKSSKSRL